MDDVVIDLPWPAAMYVGFVDGPNGGLVQQWAITPFDGAVAYTRPSVADAGTVELVRDAIRAEITRQSNGSWPVDDLVDTELDFDELARAVLTTLGTDP